MDCDHLIHPFHDDPGVSQHQRMMEDLLSGSPKVDGRTLADLLDYFSQLSRHINYYDETLQVTDWQPFFQKSVPFSLAAIIKYRKKSVEKKWHQYQTLFSKNPSGQGLQLMLNYFFYSSVKKINTWHIQLKDSGLPTAQIVERIIKDKLSLPLKKFVCLANLAASVHGVRRIDFSKIAGNEIWNLDPSSLVSTACAIKGRSKRARLENLMSQLTALFPVFQDTITVISASAEMSIEKSLEGLKDELKQRHPPHLALLFAFLKLFKYLQDDLNGFTKKHLDFFYKDVLRIKPNPSVADKAHVVFEIQKQLDKYLLKQGLLARDGKDDNKEEVYFALDDEIVVNKAQVSDRRTLFLNNKTVYDATYLEGVYMAPDAAKADGVDIGFTEDAKNVPTLGARNSKHALPESRLFKPYPNARLGFVMASPVLLLNEGKRTVDITLACTFKANHCSEIAEPSAAVTDPCCEERDGGETYGKAPVDCGPQFIPSKEFYSRVNEVLQNEYYYVSEELIQKATKKGIAPDLIRRLKDMLVIQPVHKLCYCPVGKTVYDKVVRDVDFNLVFTAAERKLLWDFFQPRRAFRIHFSGEKEWIEPIPGIEQKVELVPDPPGGSEFKLHINVVLDRHKPAVTFYNKDALKEDFDTELPLVKVELDDAIKIVLADDQLKGIADSISTDRDNCCPENRDCCVLKDPAPSEHHYVSLYHFFRNVVFDSASNDQTNIKVQVCGLRNFIVQNDEAVQSVDGPIYPFGTRPKIIDFDINNPLPAPPPQRNLVGPSFYIGSQEVFCKKWNEVYVNLNWKDKPVDFREYYKAYWADENDTTIHGLDEDKFELHVAVLENGKWVGEKLNPPHTSTAKNPFTLTNNRRLFDPGAASAFCDPPNFFEQTIKIVHDEVVPDPQFELSQEFNITNEPFNPYGPGTVKGFLRLTLQNQDFLHKDYTFTLARQMMALGKFPDQLLEGAIYIESGNTIVVFRDSVQLVIAVENAILNTRDFSQTARDSANDSVTEIVNTSSGNTDDITFPVETTSVTAAAVKAANDALTAFNQADGTIADLDNLKKIISFFDTAEKKVKEINIPIPNEPWTPVIKEISLDYSATASITDISLIHLYPFKDTNKREEIAMGPALFPTFCDEGNLFIGLKDLVPGSNLNILFQLAEATADSESERERLSWYYLDNNQWKRLRPGFEVIGDATDGLTTSGVVKFALPANMTKDNSVMPKGLHWIKAGIREKSRSVSETIGIHTQAVSVTFTNEERNDKLRLAKPLEAGKISKLKTADASVKKITQPYESFGGRVPEIENQFYIRVSERLRHKGRAIQKFDYERLALEQFPQLFKVKCINHSFALDASQFKNDFPVSPGYVILAVIPDLNQLKAGKSFEPKVPVSLLEKINDYLRLRTSPFVRLRVMNPRYEKINFCIKIKLQPGKDVSYYKEKLGQDLSEFLAPWAIGEYGKLSFGQCVNRSDVIRFLEERDYLDYIIELAMGHEYDRDITGQPDISPDRIEVCPKTPRSILVAGEIDICIKQNDCDKWGEGDCGNREIEMVDYCND